MTLRRGDRRAGCRPGPGWRRPEDKLDEPAYLTTMLPEELLEMSGALLFAPVLLGVARRARPGHASPAVPAAGRSTHGG